MKNKNGYTLMEILVTLGIVGVIAALTLPRLINNTNKATTGTALARAVELTQQGMSNIRQEATRNSEEDTNFENLSTIKKSDLGLDGDSFITDDNAFYNDTQSFLGTDTSDYNIANIKYYSGNESTNTLTSGFMAYKFNKTNMVVMFHNVTNDNIANAENDTIISRVIIDANGIEGPNRFGKDVFLFGLTNAGNLIPAGTEQYYNFDNTVTTGACNGDSVGDGTACAARVMADKWEIKY